MNTVAKFTLLLLLSFLSANTIYAQCTVDAGNDVTICPGGNTQLTPTANGDGVITYSWSPATGLSCTDCAQPIATPATTTTYTVTITDEDDCSTIDNVTVTVSDLPNSGFTADPSGVCANIPVQFTPDEIDPNYTYSWNFDNPPSGSNNTSTETNSTHEFVSVGNGNQTFTVTLVVTNENGCQTSSTLDLSVSQLPGAELLDPITNFRNCDGTNFNITVYNNTTATDNTNYQIIWGDGTPDYNSATFPGGGLTHTYATADIFDLTFIVTGSNGCVETITQIVSNITNPAIGAANPGATTGCGPLDLCFPLSNYITNHPSTIYIIDFGDNSPVDTLPHPPPASLCHTYSETSCGQAGNAFTFSIQAENLCDNSLATISPIRIYTGPEAEFTASPDPGCVNAPITFVNTSTLGFNSTCQATTIFNWDFGDGTTLTQFALTNPTHAYAAPGNYTVTLEASNSCGTTTHQEEICIELPPTPSFIPDPSTSCIPFNVQIDNDSDTSNSCAVDYQWTVIFNGSTCLPSAGTWDFANGTDANSWEPQFVFNAAGQYTIRLTISNSCGSYIHEEIIIAKGLPQVQLAAIQPVCAGESISPTATINDCYNDITTYSWSFTGGSPATSLDEIPGQILYATSGSYTASLEVTSECGVVVANVPVEVNDPPTALISGLTEACSDEVLSIGMVAEPGVTYSWSPTTDLTSPNSSTTNAIITNTGSAPITVDYTLTASTSPTCLSTDVVTLTINPIPVLIVNSPTICENESAILVVSGAGASGVYTWSPSADLSCTDCDNPTVTTATTSSYQVEGTNQYGCSSTTTSTVTIVPLPVVDAGNDLVLCDQPIPVSLNGSPSGGTWSGSPNVDATGTFTPNGTEVVTLTYTYTDAVSGCTNSDQVQITVNAAIVPDINSLDSLCFNSGITNLEVLFEVNPTGGVFSGSGVVSPNIDPTISGIGTHDLTYTYGSGSCQTEVSTQLIVYDVPALISNNETICAQDTVQLSVSGAGTGGVYSWTPSTNLSCSDCDQPLAWPSSTTTYNVTGTTTQGCAQSIDVTVTVNPLPIVDAGVDLLLCDQPIPVTLSATPAGGTWSGSPNLEPDGTFTPNGDEISNVVYTFTNLTTGCTNTDTIQITVAPPVIPTFVLDQEICFEAGAVDLNTYLSPNPTGGIWSGSGVSGSTFTPSSAGVGTHEMTYIYGSGSCETINNVDIIVHPQPTITSSDETICEEQSVTLTANGAGINGSYFWTPSITLSCDDCQTPVAEPNTTTTYDVTGTNEFGCSQTTQVTVTVNTLPIANAGNDTTLCNLPSPVVFTGLQSGGTWSGLHMAPDGTFLPNGEGVFTATYTVVLGSGCSNSDDITITVIEPQEAVAGADIEQCTELNGTTQLTGLPAGGTWTGLNVSAGGLFTLDQTGTFELVYSYGAGNCLTRDTMYFTVMPLPIVTAMADQNICISDDLLDLTSAPIGGSWSGNGVIDAVNGVFDPVVAGTGDHTLMYTYTDPTTTCSNTDNTVISVQPLPIVDFTVDPIVCLGQTVQFTNNSTLINSVNWDFGDGNTSIVTDPTHEYSTLGFHDVQLIVTSVFGCMDSITQTIEVREPPVALFTVQPDSLCGLLDASFTNLSTGVALTYSWDFGNGATSTNQNPANQLYPASVNTDTSYTIELAVTNYCGTVTHQETIIVMPEPTAIFGTDYNTGCSPWTANFANSSIGLADSYYWDMGDGTTSTTTSPTFTHIYTTGATPTDYTIMLVAINECGQDTAYHTVTVLPNTVDAFFNTDNTSGCEDLTVNFTQYTLGGVFYSWDFGDGNTSTTYSPTHTFTDAGTYTVQLFVNDGCSYDTSSAVITVNPSPVVAFTYSPDSVCINTPFFFTNTSLDLANSSWDFGDGNTSTLTNPTHEYPNPGDYTVTLTGTSLTNGCQASYTQNVPVSVNPTSAFVASPLSGCMPLTVQFNNQSTNASYHYWEFGDGNTSGQTNPQNTYTNDGVYVVSLIVENANGCKDTSTLNITVHPLPIADFSFVSTNTCYPPTTVDFTNLTTGAIDYNWDFGDGSNSTLLNPSHTYNNAGTYTITLTATNQYGCLDVTSTTLTIYPTPEAAFTLPTAVACANDELVFESESNFADSVVWIFGDGGSSEGDYVTYTYENPDSYAVTIMVYGAGGCGDTLTLNNSITINPDPFANFNYENVQIPDPLSGTVEFENTSQGGNSYWWSFGDDNTSLEENPVHRYYSYGDFYATLVAINNYGCTDTITKHVEVDFFNGLYIPNALYPEHSDYEVSHFIPKGVGLKTFSIQIYDNWGNLIWESTALDADGRPTEAWDGTYKGNRVQEDSYVWQVHAIFMDDSVWRGKEYDKNVIKKSGTVTVIR